MSVSQSGITAEDIEDCGLLMIMGKYVDGRDWKVAFDCFVARCEGKIQVPAPGQDVREGIGIQIDRVSNML